MRIRLRRKQKNRNLILLSSELLEYYNEITKETCSLVICRKEGPSESNSSLRRNRVDRRTRRTSRTRRTLRTTWTSRTSNVRRSMCLDRSCIHIWKEPLSSSRNDQFQTQECGPQFPPTQPPGYALRFDGFGVYEWTRGQLFRQGILQWRLGPDGRHYSLQPCWLPGFVRNYPCTHECQLNDTKSLLIITVKKQFLI